MSGPLEHLRVIDMGVAIQGPGAALFVRDMGAEVIKIEAPIGESSRYHRGFGNDLPQGTPGSQFIAMNRGKRSLCLDVTTDLGLQAMHRLLKTADVFITNFRLSALDRLQLGYEHVHELNPSLVYASANGYGPNGPDAEKAMVDGTAIVRGGLASVTGYDDGPLLPGAMIADTSSAMFFTAAIVTALVARERDGVGQLVQTSALGSQLWLQMWELTHAWMTSSKIPRIGPHHINMPGPYGIYETSDGGHYLFAMVNANEAWDAFWIFANAPEEALDERWDTPMKRVIGEVSHEDVEELQGKIRSVFKTKSTQEWQTFLSSQPDIIWERVQNYEEVRTDPQVVTNGYVEQMPVSDLVETSVVGNLAQFSQTPSSTHGPPPKLGEHNGELLTELGFSDQEQASIDQRLQEVRIEMGMDDIS